MKMSIAGTVQAVQMVETFLEEAPAEAFYNAIVMQVGITHVRLLRPSRSKPGYRVQALMVGDELPADAVPDGMRNVRVTEKMLAHYDVVQR